MPKKIIDCAYHPFGASEENRLLTQDQVQERYGIAAVTLRNWIRLGRLRPQRATGRAEIGRKRSSMRYELGDLLNAIAISETEPGSAKPDAAGG